MLIRTAAALALLLTPVAGLAEGRSEAMLDLLNRVPAAALRPRPGSYAQVHFVDNRVAGRLADRYPAEAGSFADLAGPYARAATMPMGKYLQLAFDGGWESRVGFGPFDVEAMVSFDTPPDDALLLQLGGDAAARVAPALLAHGYAETERDGLLALARGERDHDTDLAKRDPADPFGGDLGESSRVLVEGSFVLQASSWPTLRALAGQDGPQGHPDLAAMAQAIDLPLWGDAELVQAIALPHQGDIAPGSNGGLPGWRLGLLADLDSGEDQLALALFSYASRPEAATAARRIAEGWDQVPTPSPVEEMIASMLDASRPQRSPAEITQAEVETGVAGDGPFVAWAALRPAPGAAVSLRNPSFRNLLGSIFTRELLLFGPP